MKQIYMYETLLLIADKMGGRAVEELITSGRQKKSGSGLIYLLIE
jgi:hypothetical protein